jgi:hypothetical protein
LGHEAGRLKRPVLFAQFDLKLFSLLRRAEGRTIDVFETTATQIRSRRLAAHAKTKAAPAGAALKFQTEILVAINARRR